MSDPRSNGELAYQLRAVDFAYAAHRGGEAVPVLHGVSMEVRRGRLVAVIGPNGSGKTTLMKLMTGQLHPDAGQVLLDDVAVMRYAARDLARRVGYVPQETAPAFEFTALQIVLMGRSPYLGRFGFESEADVAIARDCMARTDTGRFEGRLFDELSSGERQRVVIARALAQQPRVLLLDEPTSFLDIGHQVQIYRLLRELVRAKGMTVVCISHDLNVAGQFADELILLHEGRVAATGPAEQVLTAETVGEVYGLPVSIMPHPQTGRPVILPTEEGP